MPLALAVIIDYQNVHLTARDPFAPGQSALATLIDPARFADQLVAVRNAAMRSNTDHADDVRPCRSTLRRQPALPCRTMRGKECAVSPRWASVAGHTLWFYYLEEHQRPHVAVRGEHRATLDLETGEILAGRLPPKVHRAIRRFLDAHHDEAMKAWDATQRREPPDSMD